MSTTEAVAAKPGTVRIIFLYVIPGLIVLAALLRFLIGSPFVATENAYTRADIVAVNAEVSAPIIDVSVKENAVVKAGDLLATLDAQPFEITLMELRANLETERRAIETLKANYKAQVVSLEVAKADADFANREYQRQRKLAAGSVVSESRLDQAQHDMQVARQRVVIAEQELQRLLVSLAGDPNLAAEQHPSVMEAMAKLERAELDLDRTQIRAPVSGVVSNVPTRGDYARASFPLMSIVSADAIWVEANFKETQLTYVEPGQPVTVKIDSFPGWEWHGEVESIASATGAEFSILPPQNASGNWVKVVQRVPVRIRLDLAGDEPLLRAGLSTHVSIDTGIRRGAFTPKKAPRDPDEASRSADDAIASNAHAG